MSVYSIVIVNVSQYVAPTPATLQQTGALISQGGTITSPGTSSLLTQLADLIPLLPSPAAITSLAWAGSVVTVTTTANHGLPVGQTIDINISGSVAGTHPNGYNGTYPCTITGVATFTYPLATNPGTESVPGVWVTGSSIELMQMATTFFAQGSSSSVFVLECGKVSAANAIAFLSSYLIKNPNSDYVPGATGYFYSYQVPRNWDGTTAYLNLLASYESTTARTYFFTTTTLATYKNYTNLMKCVIAMIESPAMGVWAQNALTAIAYSLPSAAITSLAWASSVVTVTTTANHGLPIGQIININISGATPAGYNGTYPCTITGVATFTYPLAADPGTETVPGVWVTSSSGIVTATTTTAHGVAVGQWFQIQGVTPNGYNGWWQAQDGTTGSTLIYNVPSALGTESVLGVLEASLYGNAGVLSAEFSLAAPQWVALHQNPSTVNKVVPFAYQDLFGVTPFPTQGLGALVETLKLASINIVGTGAEGGIAGTILAWGTTMDGNDYLSYWYSVDWVQINLDLDTANAVINGNNNPINPLYYNQPGIDVISAVGASTMSRGVIYGLVLGTIIQTALDGPVLDANINAGLYADRTVVNAVPFVIYSLENPSDYKERVYRGMSVVYQPQNGFLQIVYNVEVTELIAQ